MTKILFTLILAASFSARAQDDDQVLDLASGLKNAAIEMGSSSNGELDVEIPAGDKVSVKLLHSNVDAGCKSLGVSNAGMAWNVSLQIGDGTQGESCVFRITEDGQSANVTLYYSASDD